MICFHLVWKSDAWVSLLKGDCTCSKSTLVDPDNAGVKDRWLCFWVIVVSAPALNTRSFWKFTCSSCKSDLTVLQVRLSPETGCKTRISLRSQKIDNNLELLLSLDNGNAFLLLGYSCPLQSLQMLWRSLGKSVWWLKTLSVIWF